MQITKRQNGAKTIMDCCGSIGLGTGTDPLRDAMREACKAGSDIMIDLAAVPYVDPAGMGELISRFTAVVKSGGRITLLHVPRHVREVFDCRLSMFIEEGDTVRPVEPAPLGSTAVHRRAA